MSVLETSDLNKRYKLGDHEVIALGEVDFVVDEGEFVAIMGPSGSGKSTLLHLIGGLDQPTDGNITLNGQQLSLMNDKQITLLRRRNIGFVFQFYNLIPTLSAEENITLPLIIDGANKREYSERVETILELIGLRDRRTHKPEQLSGGEQQRIALARALITMPAIVLADEPTGNLDSKTGKAIMQLLRRSCDELGQTMIIVTHDPTAASIADRVVFLRDGKIDGEISFDHGIKKTERLHRIIEKMEELE